MKSYWNRAILTPLGTLSGAIMALFPIFGGKNCQNFVKSNRILIIFLLIMFIRIAQQIGCNFFYSNYSGDTPQGRVVTISPIFWPKTCIFFQNSLKSMLNGMNVFYLSNHSRKYMGLWVSDPVERFWYFRICYKNPRFHILWFWVNNFFSQIRFFSILSCSVWKVIETVQFWLL